MGSYGTSIKLFFDGVLITNCLITLPSKQFSCLPVVLHNESGHDVSIPPKTVLAELGAVQSIIKPPLSQSDSSPFDFPTPSESAKPSSLSFDFGDSLLPFLPFKWKERITNRLNAIPEVFAQHDLDFGHTDKVRHHIKLSNETPFKQRARPIHPQDVDAVCKRLQELFETGIIREAESPFSSPIVVIRKKGCLCPSECGGSVPCSCWF